MMIQVNTGLIHRSVIYVVMGTLLVKTGFKTQKVFLKNHNVLGRHSSSDVFLGKQTVIPLFWLELRWLCGQWCWRVLNQVDQTMGSGKMIQNDWRVFKSTVRLERLISLEIIDDSAPEILIEDVINKCKFRLCDFPILQEVNGQVFYEGKRLIHEEHFYFHQRLYQLWLADENIATENQIFDLCAPHCHLDIDLEHLEATFTLDKQSLKIVGECARILWVYASAKKDGNGWLSTEEAFIDWVAVGGNEQSDLERLSWERSRLRRLLSEQKAENAVKLFIRKKNGYQWLHSLVIPAENINII